jgi:hypothetical protein
MDDSRPIPLKQMAERYGKTVSTLKAEADRGNLVIFKYGREWCTTEADMLESFRKCRENRKVRGFTSIRSVESGLSETDRISAAQASLKRSLNGLKSSSRTTSAQNTRPSRQARHS